MERSARRGASDVTHDDHAAPASASPGKQSLTQALGRSGGTAPVQSAADGGPPATDSEPTRQTAAAGVSGPGEPLPHRERIQRLFGPAHDVTGISAHVGGPAAEAADQIGARAYATGNDVAFAKAPDLHTAAHEAAHVVQQRAGVQLKGGVGDAGDTHEQHADAVADRVVSGESAADLLGAGATGQGGAVVGAAVQRAPAPAAADVTKTIADLDKASTEGQWEVIRKRVYPREAAAARSRANERRGGKIPDLAGLGSVVSLDAIAAAIKALQGAWGSKKPKERGDDMIAAGNAALTRAKVPTYLDHAIVEMSARGSFSRAAWKFNIRKATVEAPSLNNDEAGEVANTVAHESRHAEQHFLRARYLAGTGKLEADIEAATGVPNPIATAAVAQKMSSADPRFAEAKKMDTSFGVDGAKNRAFSDKVDTEITKLDSARGDAIASRTALKAGATAAKLDDAKKKLAALTAQTLAVEKAYLAYRAIPHEADSHEVGDSESEAFSKLP